MKRTGIDHPKTESLAIVLALPHYSAVGILEMLWQWTAKHAPAGDIGKWDDSAIAKGIKWDRDPAQLVQALVQCRLLDANKKHRLVVHDWSQHADDSVHMSMARSVGMFCDGTFPRLSRLSKDERNKIETAYAQRTHGTRTQNARHTHGVRTKNALPCHPLPSHPSPSHPIEIAAVAGGVGGEVQERGAATTHGMTPAQQAVYATLLARPSWLPQDREWIEATTARGLALRDTSTPAHVGYWLGKAKERRREVRDVNLAGYVIGKLEKPDRALVEALSAQEQST